MNEPLNVCLLNDSFPPVIDGVATTVLNYARIIDGVHGSAVVATPYYPGATDAYPFPVIRYPSVKMQNMAGYRLGLPVLAVRGLKKHKIDVIHTHCPTISALVAKSLRTAVKAPLIMTYHTKFDVDVAHAFESPIMRFAAMRMILSNIEACDEVWAVSHGAGKNLRKIGYTGDYRIMPNGVDFPKGKAPASDIERLRYDLGAAPDTTVLLFVGRMMWYKGIRLILDGLAMAKARGTAFKMVFVGGGTDFDEITAYAATAGLAGECHFAGPVTERDELRVYYSAADMFLFPSTFDTSGIVVREAAACGLPSILIRGSSAADDIEDGVSGILIDENAESLARAVALAAQNLEAMRELGAHAMHSLYMPWDEAVARAYDRYYDVCGAHKTGRLRKKLKALLTPPPRYQ